MLSEEMMKNMFGMELSVGATGFSFFDAARRTGLEHIEFRIVAGGRPHAVRYGDVKALPDGFEAAGSVEDTPLLCCTRFRLLSPLNAISVTHSLANPSTGSVRIAEAETGQFSVSAGILIGPGHSLGMNLRYCHTDNVRTERYPHCQGEYPYVRPLPTHPVSLGVGEDQPFPAIYFTDRHYERGLVIGALSQETTFQTFHFCKAAFTDRSLFSTFRILHEFAQTEGLELLPGRELALDGTYFQFVEKRHPQDAYVDYIELLAGRLPFRGSRTPLLNEAFYCSWNYGVFDQQYEAALLETARFMKDRFPNIRFFLMDAGYVSKKDSTGGALSANFLDRFYGEPDACVDEEKFPHGIRHFSDELRKLGLRPGIWWSPTARIDSPLYRDHPDWYLRNSAGEVYRIGEHNGFLDFSVPEVARFVDGVLDVVLGKWGMDALKMDFWSQNFEDRDGRIHDSRMTSVQCRKVLFELVRKHLPPDGIFMTCVATGMGNPFIALYADAYRNTIDIGAGTWEEQVNNCIWALPTLFSEGRKTFLLNNDSFGFNLQCPDNENLFRMTWGFITMGMQEIGGRLEELPERYVRAMRKFTDRCDRGYRCLCPDEGAFTGVPLPAVLYVTYPPESPTRHRGIAQSLALFNWTDEPRIVSVRRAALGQAEPVQAVNFWTDEEETFGEEFIIKRLAGRSALLYDILA